MAKEIREIIAFQEEQLVRQNDREGLGRLSSLKDSIDAAEKSGVLPASLPQFAREQALPSAKKPEIVEVRFDLAKEWQCQANNFVDLDFHKQLKQSRQEYLEKLPQFLTQPENYRGRLDVPMLVETRISWPKQAELAGILISDYLRERIAQTKPFDERSRPPKTAYTGYFNGWDQRFLDPIRPIDARGQLTGDEVGAGPFEGIAQNVHHPEVIKSGKYFDLIGYSVESDDVPDLGHWDDRAGLSASLGGVASGYWRPLVRGSEIGTK